MHFENFIKHGSFLFTFCLLCGVGCKNISEESRLEKTKGFEEISLAFLSKDSVKAKGLISVEAAKMLLNSKRDLTLFEVSKREKYAEGHIPGASHIWRPDYASKEYNYDGMRASREEMENLLSEKGVHPDDLILIYDVKGSCDALRFGFLLEMYGHPNFRVINGGKRAWKEANFELSSEVPEPKERTDFKFSNKNNEFKLASLKEVEEAINDPSVILLDTREAEEFKGEPYINKGKLYSFKKGAFAAGCIPSAIHLNWSDAVELHTDHRFKCLKDLKYNYEKAGITPDKEIIVYCQSGVRSAHTTFVLSEILGYPNVKNYDGSWIEWSYFHKKDQSVPIEKHTSESEHNQLLAELKKQL